MFGFGWSKCTDPALELLRNGIRLLTVVLRFFGVFVLLVIEIHENVEVLEFTNESVDLLSRVETPRVQRLFVDVLVTFVDIVNNFVLAQRDEKVEDVDVVQLVVDVVLLLQFQVFADVALFQILLDHVGYVLLHNVRLVVDILVSLKVIHRLVGLAIFVGAQPVSAVGLFDPPCIQCRVVENVNGR